MTLGLLSVAPFRHATSQIGQERALKSHLQDGAEASLPMHRLLAHGRALFDAKWTIQDGGGRPLTRGTGAPIHPDSEPLVFPRAFNRVSAPDSNACSGCHNQPVPGGGGDIVTGVFVVAQRFDFATFDPTDPVPLRGCLDEAGNEANLQSIGNYRATLGMAGSGYIEMLARQMTADLQVIRDATLPGQSSPLMTKGVSFGTIVHNFDGTWDTTAVEGLPPQALLPKPPLGAPSLVLHPFHQSGSVVSLRQFTNNAFNHHHGMQPTERFGLDTDADGDSYTNELTRADITAATLYQATLGVPVRVIPNDPAVEAAVLAGEELFVSTGCAGCHTPSLPLDDVGWVFTEPNPYNPPGNLQVGQAPVVAVDLSSAALPGARLRRVGGTVWVPAFTDLKLHDLGSGPDDPLREPCDINFPSGTPEFFAGNSRFLTKKLWGCANEPPYFHHGQFTTMRQAIHAHGGEATAVTNAFEALSASDQDAIIEFLKTLQVAPNDVKSPVVDEHMKPKNWVPFPG